MDIYVSRPVHHAGNLQQERNYNKCIVMVTRIKKLPQINRTKKLKLKNIHEKHQIKMNYYIKTFVLT